MTMYYAYNIINYCILPLEHSMILLKMFSSWTVKLKYGHPNQIFLFMKMCYDFLKIITKISRSKYRIFFNF